MRKVFFSFDWDDVWQANQVRNSWVAKGNYTNAGFVDSADIEKVKRATAAQIKKWIDEQLSGTSVTCVLLGSKTHKSEWVKYEIQESIDKRKGLVSIYIHNVKDQFGNTSYKGKCPFREQFGWITSTGEPDYPSCTYYDWVNDGGRDNLGNWIEVAAQQAGR